MSIFWQRPSVADVFTPRRTEVNRDLYVDRPELERELKRALTGSQHPVVFGESGSGKSWLYKKVLQDLGAFSKNVNCATAQRLGSLTKVIRQAAGLAGSRKAVGKSEEMKAGVSAVVAEGGLNARTDYQLEDEDPLLEAFTRLRAAAGDKLTVLVIDNLEIIVSSEELMEELATIVALLDDERFAAARVRLLLVGVPSVMRDYFLKTPASQSIANRMIEVSEVSALSEPQVYELVQKGFGDLLRVEIDKPTLQEWQRHACDVTFGYAQQVQEFCEQLGHIVEEADWKGGIDQLQYADARWLKIGLNFVSGHVVTRMNERKTTAGRRNQVLYALGRIKKRRFNAQQVEEIVRREFPTSTADTALAIGQILTELTTGDNPMIKISAGTADFEFRDARYAMALLVLLRKTAEGERVEQAS